MESGEIIYEKVYVSPRPPPKISFKDNWMKELDSEVAGRSKDTQRIQPKTKTQEQGDPWVDNSPPSLRKQPLTSECQDCHMQLRKKQKLSAFESSWRRSKVILIEKHFKATCSRITSTTHSATIRKRWSRNWALQRYWSCAKQYRKWNVLNVFSIGIKEWSTVLADSSWLKANPEENFNRLRLDALSIPHNVIKKGRCHGARHGETEEQTEYHTAWNVWKRCCKRVDSQGEHFKGIHDRFLRDQVYRESRLAIGWTEQKCIESCWQPKGERRNGGGLSKSELVTCPDTCKWPLCHHGGNPPGAETRNGRFVVRVSLGFIFQCVKTGGPSISVVVVSHRGWHGRIQCSGSFFFCIPSDWTWDTRPFFLWLLAELKVWLWLLDLPRTLSWALSKSLSFRSNVWHDSHAGPRQEELHWSTFWRAPWIWLLSHSGNAWLVNYVVDSLNCGSSTKMNCECTSSRSQLFSRNISGRVPFVKAPIPLRIRIPRMWKARPFWSSKLVFSTTETNSEERAAHRLCCCEPRIDMAAMLQGLHVPLSPIRRRFGSSGWPYVAGPAFTFRGDSVVLICFFSMSQMSDISPLCLTWTTVARTQWRRSDPLPGSGMGQAARYVRDLGLKTTETPKKTSYDRWQLWPYTLHHNGVVQQTRWRSSDRRSTRSPSAPWRQIHLPHATFSHVQSLHRSHSTDDMCAWLKAQV